MRSLEKICYLYWVLFVYSGSKIFSSAFFFYAGTIARCLATSLFTGICPVNIHRFFMGNLFPQIRLWWKRKNFIGYTYLLHRSLVFAVERYWPSFYWYQLLRFTDVHSPHCSRIMRLKHVSTQLQQFVMKRDKPSLSFQRFSTSRVFCTAVSIIVMTFVLFVMFMLPNLLFQG